MLRGLGFRGLGYGGFGGFAGAGFQTRLETSNPESCHDLKARTKTPYELQSIFLHNLMDKV